MQIGTTQIVGPPAVPDRPIFRLSVEQYHEMIRAGILTDNDPVELLEGWLIQKMSKNPPHRIATKLTTRALEALIPAGWYVDSQEPITTESSEPEPDVAIIRGDTRDYVDRHPSPADVAIVVEVADATLVQDRLNKRRIYAAAMIATYWIVNLADRKLEVFSEPKIQGVEADYISQKEFGENDAVPVILDGSEIGRVKVREILP